MPKGRILLISPCHTAECIVFPNLAEGTIYVICLGFVFEVAITRFDAAEVAAEVEHAREVEKQMAKEAREKMREERSESFRETVARKREELKNWFSNLGGKEN